MIDLKLFSIDKVFNVTFIIRFRTSIIDMDS